MVTQVCVFGVWTPQTEANTHSYCDCTPLAVLSFAEHKKRYSKACQNRRATSTPLCMSIDGMMGREVTVTVFLRQLADLLSDKWDSYGSEMGCMGSQ